MAASFPAAKKNFAQQTDGTSDADAADVNAIYDEVEAIEGHLGAGSIAAGQILLNSAAGADPWLQLQIDSVEKFRIGVDASDSDTFKIHTGALADPSLFEMNSAGKFQLGGPTDWGTGATGTQITGAGYDWVSQTVGRVNTDLNNCAAAAAYHAMTVTADQTGNNTVLGTWTELYIKAGLNLPSSNNYVSVWGNLEIGADVETASISNCVTALLGSLTIGATYDNDARTCGCLVTMNYDNTGAAGSGRISAFEMSVANDVFDYGLYIPDSTVTTGIDIGSCTRGIDFTGTEGSGTGEANICMDVGRGADFSLGIYLYGSTDKSIYVAQYMTAADTKPVEFYGMPTSLTAESSQGVLQINITRDASYAMSGTTGNPDTVLRLRGKNEANNTVARGGLRGIDLEVVNSEASSINSYLHAAMFTAENTSEINTQCDDMQVLQLVMSNQGIVDSSLYGLRVLENSEGTIPTDTVGIKVTTSTNAPASGTRADGVMITTGGATGGWTDGLHIAGTITNAINISGTTIGTGVNIGACATAGINIVTGQVTGINIAGTCSTAGISMAALSTDGQAVLVTWSGTPSESTAADAAIVSVTGTSSAAGGSGDQLIGYYAKVVTSTGDQANNWLVGYDAYVESQHNVDRLLGVRIYTKFNDSGGTIDTGCAAIYAICDVAQPVTVSDGPLSCIWARWSGDSAVTTATTSCFFGDIDDDIARGLDFDVANGKTCTTGIALGRTGTGTYTTGIDIGTCTTGVNFSGTITEGVDYGSATLTTDASRENSFRKCGTFTTQKTWNMSTDNHAYAFQANVIITGTLGTDKKAILHYNKIQTDTANTGCRLKCNENYTVVGAEVKDAHVVYGELYWKGGYQGVGVNNEGFGGAFTVDTDTCNTTPTGLLYGIKARIKGASLNTAGFAHCAAFFVTENSTFTNTRFTNLGGATITNMIDSNQAGTCTNFVALNGAFTNLWNFDAASGFITSGGTDCTASGATDPTYTAKVITPDGNAGYIRIWAAA